MNKPPFDDKPRSLPRLLRPVEMILAPGAESSADDPFARDTWNLRLRVADTRADALAALWRSTESNVTGDTLLIDLDDQDGSAPPLQAARPSLLNGGITPRWTMVDDADLPAVLDELETRSIVLVRMHGPVEPSDVLAIAAAARRADGSVLDAEVRATAAMWANGRLGGRAGATRDNAVRLELDTQSAAYAAGAEIIRSYVSHLRGTTDRIGRAPESSIIERLFGVSGTISIRPIETDVFSTSVDIGVGTAAIARPAPATTSVVYDVFSDTWHDEP